MTDKHEHKTCGCSHGHGHENKTCGCGHDHEHEHEKCGCTCGCDGKGGGLSLWIRAGMTGACWIGGHAIFHNWVKILLFSVALFIIGYDVLWSAIKGVVKGKVFGETLLMTIAAVAAAVIGEWHEAIAVLLLFQIGEALQGYCTKKTENRVLSLVSLNVDTAVLIADGEAREVAAQSVTVGSIVEVRAGAKVPLDGVVQEGESTLDTSMLTGESLPVFVKRGDKIYGGSINGGGRLLVRTTAAFSDGAAQKILSMVQSAAGRKAKSQKFITAFARIYTPVVCFAAICLAFLPLAFGQSIQVWGRRALVFLVSSCPCALVISVPLAYFAGIGKAAANGVLVKGGTQLDALAKMRAIATDKTGTLTDGRMQVLRVQGEDERQTIALAAAVERYSDHPLARAICEFAKGIALPDVHSTEERAGQGMVATYRGKTLVVGSRRLLASHGIRVEDGDGTTVHFALGDVCVGAIVLGDRAKEGAKEALAAFVRAGDAVLLKASHGMHLEAVLA